ncbi:PepSY domain-containing protein [Streptomyces sp. NPDC008121]|uniref:PepSY domain-containing protein n=1 Tax=Streptomyces sp. NPDC008121 TaxID=3364809 RepID=UPI0036E43DD1
MKRNIVIATVAAAAVVCGGTAAAFADDAGTGGTGRGGAAEARTAKVTAVQAIDAALKAQPGTVVSADLDLDDDGDGGSDEERGWEVDVLGQGTTSYTVHVDSASGKVLGKETETDDDDANDDGAARSGSVDARQAAEAASAKGFVTSVDRDDDGAAAWEAETASGDWRVDPKTGQVTADRDDDADSAGAKDDTKDGAGDKASDDTEDDTKDGAGDKASDGTEDDAHDDDGAAAGQDAQDDGQDDAA